MNRTGKLRNSVRLRTVVAVVAAGVMVAACSSGSSGTAANTSTTQSVVTYAEQPQTPPNYIFPFMSLTFFSVTNSEQFQYLMYRPLYWFGQGSTPDLNPSLSLAAQPTYSNNNTVVTINLNPYKWSNGETLTAQNVMFWMNMLHAQKANWAAYAPGTLPDDVQNVTVNSPTQLTMTLTGAVNTYWFTYNELSQITPMPNAWDVTATGAAPDSGGCATAAYGTADAACTNVYTFLSKQAGYDPANPKASNNSLSTYATNPLWGVVDGPWKLTNFDASGNVTMTANPSYSGPVKPTIKTFQELPYTSESAEFNALVGGKVDVGYLPPADVTDPTTNALKAGPNNPRLAGTYNMDPLYTWAINYFPYNYNSSGNGGTAGKIFSQLYFRQAMQYLVDQPLYIQKVYKGYAVGTYGPVPSQPANSFVSAEVQNNPYPYSPAKAVSLLKSHGWTVVPGGTSTCASAGTGPSQCGAGIPAGTKLDLQLQYDSGNDATAQVMTAEKASWSSAGINVALSTASFNTVLANAVPCSGGSSCSWQLANWGAGWLFSPDYYPTGESIFQTGAGSNSGSYSDSTNDANILATNQTQVPLTQYENYLAEQLPVVWEPNNSSSLTETAKGLNGTTPQSPLWSINPENWRFTS
jgi:peptide/nickel transport system substrate-binding protein